MSDLSDDERRLLNKILQSEELEKGVFVALEKLVVYSEGDEGLLCALFSSPVTIEITEEALNHPSFEWLKELVGDDRPFPIFFCNRADRPIITKITNNS